ncbi:DUF4041 domain-containing protein [Paenarthrobacter sp. PH39-S1]|uniref:DUF4041 domain-containing protein n=1 Tax=Paenarthrobacter sp. PH39-S1 TaxID=3046204 RepID=UPI0024BBDD59|nr:DUF4041 domain-containing protein [Paenarthrobacter sp. PH39-S1]MDJ0358264.1 DUF4041 domain-containing protein [Paenarthrobacter sp. PH39-S1]
MPQVSLPKGANAVIASPLHAALRLELRWTAPSATDELDLFMLLLDSNGRITDNADIVFYNQPDYAAGAAKYLGRNDAGPGQAHNAEITLGRLPENVYSIAIAAALDSEDSQLGALSSLDLTATSDFGTLFSIPCEGLSSERVAVVAEIYRRNGDWKVRSVSQGWNGGLPDLLTHYGAVIDDQPSSPAPNQMGTATPTPNAAPVKADEAKLSALQDLEHRIREREAVLADLESRIVETREINLLQDLGIYDFSHPLEDALQYKDRLTQLRTSIKALVKACAVTGATNWAVNGNLAKGAQMVREQCKLMLRAYNAEADNCVRTVRAHSLDANVARLERAKSSIEKLGKSMAIEITNDYHQLRLDELKLTADYHVKVANEREAQRTLREEAREQEKVERELQKAREKVEQERSKYQAALAIAIENGEPEAIATMQQFVADADAKLHDLENRQANVRTGYVYVISNLGAFGDRIVKIGMTRRLEPTERIRELSGAGVPFLYDVHVLFFSEDAAALEAQLHREFEAKRVNKVNLRREFFYATPAEVKEAVNRLVGVTTLEFKEESEASEFRLSLSLSKGK